MIECFMSYLQRFSAGEISYDEFSQAMHWLLDAVDDINNILDGTMMRSFADNGAQTRMMVGEMVLEYKQFPELSGLAVATCD
jgi:hypothetical protein